MEKREQDNCLVCGRAVPRAEGIREAYRGVRCCFCSPECQAKFEEDPARYAAECGSVRKPEGYW